MKCWRRSSAKAQKHRKIAEEWQIPDAEGYARARTEKECYDAFQSLEYEVNTLHTANGQTPFVTFGFGLGTSWESRLIQQSILRNRIAGLGKNRKTAVFPKLVFAIRDGLNHKFGDPNYDIKQLALECASKRMYPDILNYDQVVKVTGSFKTPMGCRSFLGVWENENGEQVHDGRNNLGVISLNLPRIATEAKGDEAAFWALLDERLQLARKALMTRIARLEGVKARVAPILYMEGACGVRLKADDDVSEIFKNGRASISLGYIGIHETINALYGNQHMYDSEALREKGVAIVQRLRDAVDLWKEETGYGFSLYSTPSENLCDRFCRLDTAEFGVVEGVTDKGYYTNSFHLDVEKKVNPYDKIDFEAPYPPLANGGSFATASTRISSITSRRWKTCGITAISTCRTTGPIRRSMSATSAVLPASSSAPARALPARNAVTTTPPAFPLPAGCAVISAARTRGRSTPASRKK